MRSEAQLEASERGQYIEVVNNDTSTQIEEILGTLRSLGLAVSESIRKPCTGFLWKVNNPAGLKRHFLLSLTRNHLPFPIAGKRLLDQYKMPVPVGTIHRTDCTGDGARCDTQCGRRICCTIRSRLAWKEEQGQPLKRGLPLLFPVAQCSAYGGLRR